MRPAYNFTWKAILGVLFLPLVALADYSGDFFNFDWHEVRARLGFNCVLVVLSFFSVFIIRRFFSKKPIAKKTLVIHSVSYLTYFCCRYYWMLHFDPKGRYWQYQERRDYIDTFFIDHFRSLNFLTLMNYVVLSVVVWDLLLMMGDRKKQVQN
jgi:hypothetical protein